MCVSTRYDVRAMTKSPNDTFSEHSPVITWNMTGQQQTEEAAPALGEGGICCHHLTQADAGHKGSFIPASLPRNACDLEQPRVPAPLTPDAQGGSQEGWGRALGH